MNFGYTLSHDDEGALPADRADAWERIQGGEGLVCGECNAKISRPEDLRDLEHAERVLGEHFLVCPGGGS